MLVLQVNDPSVEAEVYIKVKEESSGLCRWSAEILLYKILVLYFKL